MGDGGIIIIEVPGPVRGKGRHRSRIATTAGGQAFVTNYPDPGTLSYEGRLAAAAVVEMDGAHLLDGPLLLKLLAVFAVPASWSQRKRQEALSGAIRPTVKPDADNIMKLIDSLNGIVWHDDRQVVTATLRKVYGERPALRLEVIPIVPEATQAVALPPPGPLEMAVA